MKILMITIQTEKEKLIIFDDKITDIKSNKEIEARIENCLLGAEN